MTTDRSLGRRSGGHRGCSIAAIVLALVTAVAGATPRVPTEDSEVLEHVPARAELDRLAALHPGRSAPANLDAALTLARGYIDIGRRASDPRYIGYAQAILLPWLDVPNPPEQALVLQAITLQYLHKFDAALTLLNRALVLQPLDGQAWLTQASLLELRGDYASARRSCARLVRSADEVTALTCIASVDGRSGHLAASYATLGTAAATNPRLPPGVLGWILSVRAEMAERLGYDRHAEADLRAALALSPEDPYLRATYADLLLRLDRPREVILLLAGAEAQDPLLLRLAIAGRRAASADGPRWAAMYADRLRAAARDGDTTHRREEAMYMLEVLGDGPAALRAAAGNWTTQREPADVRVYVRAVLATGSAADRAVLSQWLVTTGFEDRTLRSTAPATLRGAT